jgi:hypothetical protein
MQSVVDEKGWMRVGNQQKALIRWRKSGNGDAEQRFSVQIFAFPVDQVSCD